MKKELVTKIETEPDDYGFVNNLLITVDYEANGNSFQLKKVRLYSERFVSVFDLTDIFKSPLFDSVINGIDWKEIYNRELIDEATERINTPYDVMMVTNALNQ